MSDDTLHFHRRAADDPAQQPPAGMTKEQLDYFTAQTVRAVRKAIRHYRNGAVAGFVILVIGLGISLNAQSNDTAQRRATAQQQRHAIVQSGRAVSVDGCNRDFNTIKTLRGVLTASHDFQKVALARGDISQERYNEATAFYETQLSHLKLPDCRKALNVVTDNPDTQVVIPAPLHP